MILKSKFKPASGLTNPHFQTMLPRFIRRKSKLAFYHEELELDDGDFLDLAWTELSEEVKPVVLVFHGLEGSIESPYAHGIMSAIKKQGWKAVLMHFRGCSGRMNRLPRSYHSGETDDAKQLISHIKAHYPDAPLAAVGFSLGGNMLLKLQAELGHKSPFLAAVSVSAPLLLSNCAIKLSKGFSRVYQNHLIAHMKKNLKSKASVHDYASLIGLDTRQINRINSFREFDNQVTAPLHGFKGVDDYYQKCSSRQFLKDIQAPTLVIQSLDDPFMSDDVIPEMAELSKFTRLEISQYGGHVGFIGGSLIKPVFWLERRIPEFLAEFLSKELL